MIKMQLAIGTSDKKAKKELFARQDDPDLNTVIAFLQASETANQDVQHLGMSSAEEAIAATRSIRGRGRGQGTTRGPQGKCSGCGSSLHRWKGPDCPGKACGKCGALDHFKE
ncbi:MAG: hypothetical protein GY696_22260 [Gammaproteobacteria bacterium]|nr:hypothetical protein [Gammaproteobacteria bacterium]